MKIPEYQQAPVQITRAPIRKQFVPKPPTLTKELIQFGQAAVSTAISLVQQRREQQEVDELIEAQLGTLEEVNSLMLSYESDTDFETQVKRFQSDKDKIFRKYYSRFTLENPKKGYEQWYKKSSLDWDFKIEMQSVTLERNYSQFKTFEELDRATKLPNGKALVTTILSGKTRLFKKEIREKLESECYHKIDVYRTAARSQEIFNESGIDAARQYIYSNEVPEIITKEDRDSLFGEIKDYDELIKAEKAQELKVAREKVQEEIVDVYGTGNINQLGELRDRITELDILPPVGTYSKMWWIDKIDSKIKSYSDSQKKGVDDPSEETDPEIYRTSTRMIYDPDKDLPATEKYLLEHLGNGLSSKDFQSLIKQARTHEKSYAVETALDTFSMAMENEFITPSQYVSTVRKFNEEVAKGELTEDGIFTLAENILVNISKDYLKGAVDKNILLFQKRAAKKYIEERPPEKKPIPKPEPGSPKDFESFFNITDYESKYYEDAGIWIYTDGERLYSMIDGKWHTKGPEDEDWKEYSGTEDFIVPKWY